jgi:hypothetical protein
MKNKIKHIILLLLIPLSEIKAIFYYDNTKVSWYLFSNNKKYLCNVMEDYSNIIIIGVIMFYSVFVKIDLLTRRILLFLFIINCLDFIFIGLMDNQLFLLKIPISIITYSYVRSKMAI